MGCRFRRSFENLAVQAKPRKRVVSDILTHRKVRKITPSVSFVDSSLSEGAKPCLPLRGRCRRQATEGDKTESLIAMQKQVKLKR